MNTTIETNEVDTRCQQAAERVSKLESELGQLQSRRQEAGLTVERLSSDIAQQERGGDAEALAMLRADRRAAAEVQQDLCRSITAVERELAEARAGLRAATIAKEAVEYNHGLVRKQEALLATINEALESLVQAVLLKEELAAKQDTILGRVAPYSNLRVDGIRHAIVGEIDKRLVGAPQEIKTPLKQIDWSIRPMTPYGTLEEAR